MAKTTDEVLREAADAAQKALPSAEKEVETAQRALQNASARVVRLRAVIAAGSPDPVQKSTNTVTFDYDAVPGTRHVYITRPASTAMERIAQVLAERKVPLSPKEISEKVESTFGSSLPPSTLYYTLSKGQKQGVLELNDGLWTVTQKSEGR